VLVAVAIVIGFFVLRAIDDTGAGPEVATDEPAATSDTTAPAGEPAETTGSTEPPPEPRPPGEVVVLVANASGIQGAATELSGEVEAAGYQIGTATNAPADQETTQILAVAGYEPEAAALAQTIGAPEGAVKPMPDPPPVDLAGAHLLVLLGPDLAGG